MADAQTGEISAAGLDAGTPNGCGGVAGRALAYLHESASAERERWPLWLPVLIGCGIALYFQLPSEPPPILGASMVLTAAGLVLLAWRHRGRAEWALPPASAALAVAAGFAASQLATFLSAAPVLERRTPPVMVEGRVVRVDLLPEGRRIVAAPQRITRAGDGRAALPALVRVRLARGGDALAPGDRFAVRAILLPPPPPTMPGAFDFQRQAFFDRLGAVGYAVGPAQRLAPAADGEGRGGFDWRVAVADLRHRMTERIVAVLPGGTGGVAAALITGEMGPIPESLNAAYRDSGLAHILSVSGLHMSLAAGLAFVALRALLALIPPLALRFPIKKWAAALALLLVGGYTLLAGASVPAQRSFVMIALVLLAVIVDRLQISTRTVAWAAVAVMLATPVGLLGPSFQMSFAAVIALIAFYETYNDRIAAWRRDAGIPRTALLYFLGIAITSAVATAATTPYAVYHFNRFALYALPSNALAVPITGLLVMPMAMLACLLMPFGLEAIALVPMGWGVDALNWVARTVAGWPGAVWLVPTIPPLGIALITFGGLWICIWRGRWRRWGVLGVAAGVATLALARPPDVIVAGDAGLVAVRGADGSYMMSTARGGRIERETWARRAAASIGEVWPVEGGASGDGSLRCDSGGCLYRQPSGSGSGSGRGRTVAIVHDGAALDEECRTADLVIADFPVRRPCRARARVIDRIDVWRWGAHAVWLDDDGGGVRIESVDKERGRRPWVPVKRRRAESLSQP
jgi:competence protein ComEC